MALNLFDSGLTAVDAGGLFTTHDGTLGGVSDQLLYIQNDDLTKWYTNLVVALVGNGYTDLAQLSADGWMIKYIPGGRRPTEAEWDRVSHGLPITLADIGTQSAGDSSSTRAFWIRVICPASTSAQLVDLVNVSITALERAVI